MISLASTLAIGLVAETYTRLQLQNFVQHTARTLAGQTAHRIAQHALANDVLAMNLLLNSLVGDPAIRAAQLFGVDHRLIAAAGDVPALTENPQIDTGGRHELVVVEPVSYDNVLAGHLRMTWSLAGFHTYQQQMRFSIALTGVILLLLALWAGHHLGRRLASSTEVITAGMRSLGVKVQDTEEDAPDDELQQLARHLSKLAASQAAEDAANDLAIIRDGGMALSSELCAVLVMEPVGLHELLNQFEAEQINGQLRRAYELVRRSASLYQARHCLIEHNRVLVLYTGGSDDEPEMFRAICSARLILQLLERMRTERTGRDGPSVHFRGIVHGGQILLPEQLSGEIHLAELDGQEGAVVRMAVRMLEHARKDELLASAAAIDHPTVLEKTRLGSARNARTRESDTPLALFPVNSLAPGYEILQERQGENLLYAARSY